MTGETALTPAATLVLLRPADGPTPGFEVLLTRRPDSMRFGPGMHVFPGGRLEAGEDAAAAAVRETSEETGIEVDPATLIALTRWVTPPGLSSRFDARFFGAIVPRATDVRQASGEVAGWAWLRPTAALEGMAAGRLAMWQPTVVTLQQVEPVVTAAELAPAFAPIEPSTRPGDRPDGLNRSADPSVDRSIPTMWLAGIDGRPGSTRLVGRRSWVVLNPGDPTEVSFERVVAAAGAAGATLAGVVVEDLAPEHHAGVELFARGLGLAIAGPPGADAAAPYPVTELADGATLPFGDVAVRVTQEAPAVPGSGAPRWADRAGRIRLRLG